MNYIHDKWLSLIKGLVACIAIYSIGFFSIFIYQAYSIAIGIVSVDVLDKSKTVANEFWYVLTIGSISFGVAVWLMDLIAKRLGKPFSD